MTRASMLIGAALAASLAAPLGGSALAEDPPIKRTVLQRSDVPGAEGKEVVMYEALIGPGASSGRHTHPGPETFYVVEGALILEPDGQEPATLRKGESGRNPPEHVHNVKNASATEPARVVAVVVAPKGAPLATPAK